MDESGGRMAQRVQVDVTLGPAARALDLELRLTSVHGLIDRRRRIDGPAVGPHPLVPRLAQQLVRRPDQPLPLGPRLRRLRSQDRRHGAGAAELLLQRLAVATGEWGSDGACAPWPSVG